MAPMLVPVTATSEGRKDDSMFEVLRYDVNEIYNVGDSRKVRNIRGAIWDTCEVARNV